VLNYSGKIIFGNWKSNFSLLMLAKNIPFPIIEKIKGEKYFLRNGRLIKKRS
jgi:hypothetical protein